MFTSNTSNQVISPPPPPSLFPTLGKSNNELQLRHQKSKSLIDSKVVDTYFVLPNEHNPRKNLKKILEAKRDQELRERYRLPQLEQQQAKYNHLKLIKILYKKNNKYFQKKEDAKHKLESNINHSNHRQNLNIKYQVDQIREIKERYLSQFLKKEKLNKSETRMRKKHEMSKSADSQSEFINNKTTIDYHKSIDEEQSGKKEEMTSHIKIKEEEENGESEKKATTTKKEDTPEDTQTPEEKTSSLPPVANESKNTPVHNTPKKKKRYSRMNQSPYHGNEKKKKENQVNRTINQSISYDKQTNNSARKNKSSDKYLVNSNSTRSNIIQNKNNQMLLKLKELQFKSKKLPKYFYSLGGGNNAELIRRVLARRNEWNEVTNNSLSNPHLVNFKWQQNSWGYHYEKLTGESGIHYQLLNHFEFHKELTTKSGLVKNLQRNLQTPFDITPLTYIITLDSNIDTEFQWFTNFYFNNCPFNNPKNYVSIPNARIFYSYNGKKEIQNVERNKSVKIVKLGEEFFDGDHFLWLLKPIDFNRGNGIHVFSKIEELENLLNSYYNGLYIKQCKDEEGEEKEQEKEKELGKPLEAEVEVKENQQDLEVEKEQTIQHIEENQQDNHQYHSEENIKEGEMKEEEHELNKEDKDRENDQTKEDKDQENDKNNNEVREEEQIKEEVKEQDKIKEENKEQKTIKEENAQETIKEENNQQRKDEQNEVKAKGKDEIITNKQSNAKEAQKQKNEQVDKKLNNKIEKNTQQQQKPQQQQQQKQQQQGFYVKCSQFVIQKYIERPFLIHDRKFDIRMWCLLTHQQIGFVFKEGYIRTSCEKFNLEERDNPFIHLTNNAIQKHSKKYGTYEDGNQMSFKEFQDYLDSFENNTRNFKNTVSNFLESCLPIIKAQMISCFNSVKSKINKFNRKFCFEIFGFDFIVDANFKIWLIEINTNPCLEESSNLLQQLLPRMIDDAFKITLDVLFPLNQMSSLNEEATKSQIYNKHNYYYAPSQYKVEEYPDNQSMWEYLNHF